MQNDTSFRPDFPQLIQSLLSLSENANSSYPQQPLFDLACKAVVDILKADHSAVVIFEAGYREGKVRAEFPGIGALQETIPIGDVAAEQELLQRKKPLIFRDLTSKECEGRLGPVIDNFRRWNIRASVITPILSQGRVVGSFSLDRFKSPYDFSDTEIRTCELIASIVSGALEKVEATESLGPLMRTVLQNLMTSVSRDQLFENVANRAAELTSSVEVSVFQHIPDQDAFVPIAWTGTAKPALSGTEITAFRRLTLYGMPFLPLRATDTLNVSPARDTSRDQALGVLIGESGEPFGVLRVARSGTRFRPQEIQTLRFISQAAFGVLNAVDAIAREALRLAMQGASNRADSISDAVNAIMRLASAHLKCDYFRVALDYDGKVVRYGSSPKGTNPRITPEAKLDKEIAVVLRDGESQELYRFEDTHRPLLDELTQRSGQPLDSAMLIPIALAGERAGWMELGWGPEKAWLLHISHTRALAADAAVQVSIFVSQARLQHFANRIAIEHIVESRVSFLGEFARFMAAERDRSKILNALLTAVTASYGLGFNRAAVFLLSTFGDRLLGADAVGERDQRAAEEAWARFHQSNLKTLEDYLSQLDAGLNVTTGMHKEVVDKVIDMSPGGNNALTRAVHARSPGLIERDWESTLPAEVIQLFEPTTPLFVVPLVAKDHVEGVLFADNKFTPPKPVAESDRETLFVLCSLAAQALANIRLQAPALDRPFLSDSPETAPSAILAGMVKRICVQFEFAGATVILADEKRRPYFIESAGQDRKLDLNLVLRPNGVSRNVLSTGLPILIPDLADAREKGYPSSREAPFGASACLPFSARNETLGVVWLHSMQKEDRESFKERVGLVQTYVALGATEYAIAVGAQEQRYMMSLAARLSDAPNYSAIAEAIVDQGIEIFNADFGVFWPYDPVRKDFLEDDVVCQGVDPEAIQPPRQGGQTFEVLKAGLKVVEDAGKDLTDAERMMGTPASPVTLACFLAVAISVQESAQPLGVLYLNYKNPRKFREQERVRLKRFASLAAVWWLPALQGRLAATEWLKVVEPGKPLYKNMDEIASRTIPELGNDSAVLFSFDDASRRMEHPPGMAHVSDPAGAMHEGKVRPTSFLYDLVDAPGPAFIEDVAADPLYCKSRFALAEGIKAFAAVPLIYESQRIGLLFVNYRKPPGFDKARKWRIKQVAAQIAVALNAAKIHETSRQTFSRLAALEQFSQTLLKAEKIEEICDLTLKTACEQLHVEFANIVEVLPDGSLQMLRGAGWSPDVQNGYVFQPDEAMHARTTINQATPIPVDDFDLPQSFPIPEIIVRKKILSGVGVPMQSGDLVFGAMLVHSTQRLRFKPEVPFLKLLANQAAAAILKVRHLQDLREQQESLGAMKQIALSMSPSATDSLDLIARCIRATFARKSGMFCTIQLLDSERNVLVFRAADPPMEGLSALSVAPAQPGQPGGITVRVFRNAVEGKNLKGEIVNDVAKDIDYLGLRPTTRSEMAVPLFDGDKVVGVVDLESEEQDDFRADDLDRVLDLRHFLSLGLHNLTLKEAVGTSRSALKTALSDLARKDEQLDIASSQLREPLRFMDILLTKLAEGAMGRLEERQRSKVLELRIAVAEAMRLANNILLRGLVPGANASTISEPAEVGAALYYLQERFWVYRAGRELELAVVSGLTNHELAAIDEYAFRLVLLNLLSNAVEASSGGRITLEAHRDGDNIVVRVSDSGTGFTPEQLTAEDVDSSAISQARTSVVRMGLGLHVCRRIMSHYGGSIRLANKPDGGARVELRVPAFRELHALAKEN